ncbi:MAG: ABC transporter substrate-binding protein [Actinobacteria bacterium]|nr:ABC transporter substrate-binding protein [Actinomycetota bacterium]
MIDDQRELEEAQPSNSVSRREFLKIAGIVGAVAGTGAGLGGLVAACSGGKETPTTSMAGGETTTSAAGGPTTTVSAEPEIGDEVKAGYVLPVTGSMAAFGVAASWHVDYFNKNVWKDGMVMGDGKKHKFTVIVQDMRSDSNRAAQVAGDLITNQGVVLIGAGASAANVVPVRDQCEALECPCVTYDCPGDAWNAGQPAGGFKWSWHTWFIFKDMAANFIAMWDIMQTNKTVGGLYPNDADGLAFAQGLPAAFQPQGYTYVDPGRFEDGTEDYTAIIRRFRKEGVEIVNGVPTPPDYANFWKQAVQQGFRPKISTEAKAMLFPDGVNALGDLGDGQTVECWFHPTFPYLSTLTGLKAQDVCDLWEQEKGVQWTQPVCLFGQFEVLTDILKRCKNPADKNEIINATKETKITTIGGPVDWTVNPDPYSGFRNFCTKSISGGQWVKGAGRWKYDMHIVTSVSQPEIKTTAAIKELVYP